MRATAAVLLLFLSLPLIADRYAVGTPVVKDVWVDPVSGNDARSGATRGEALRTLTEAWDRIPQRETLTQTGYRILIAGTIPEEGIPNYLESRWGTAEHPIIIQSADVSSPARLGGDLNVYDTRYLYLVALTIAPNPPGDAFHCELCDHILIRSSTLDGGGAAQETIKMNQSSWVWIEDSTVTAAYENAIDFVSVQHAEIIGNRISNAGDWCAYVKGGSAYVRVEGNEIFDCDTGGFTAGQGSGFQFLTPPWLHYEAYDVKVTNNVIHDTVGAGLGVNGGYNILFAHNTLYRVGSRSHMLEMVFGGRTCDGQQGEADRERCAAYLAQGGWGTTVVDDGTNFVRIPNRNVFVYNNILYNPAGFEAPQIFTIFEPYTGASQAGSNVPVPARADENVQIRGNIIWGAGAPLGIQEGSGCGASHPTCNASLVLSENAIDRFEPQLVDPAHGNYRPVPGGNVTTAMTYPIPPFTWSDAPVQPVVPPGELNNTVARDRAGVVRTGAAIPGAYTVAASPQAPARRRSVQH